MVFEKISSNDQFFKKMISPDRIFKKLNGTDQKKMPIFSCLTAKCHQYTILCKNVLSKVWILKVSEGEKTGL